jgi:hypothetical protein
LLADLFIQSNQFFQQINLLRVVEIPPDRLPLTVGFGQYGLGALRLKQL